MLQKFINYLNFHLTGFGFKSTEDLMQSVFHYKSIKPIIMTSSILGSLAFMIEDYLGLSAIAYLSFIFLIIAEFVTGVKASLKKNVKVRSRKIGRMIIKIAVYTCIIGLIHTFSKHIKTPEFFGFEADIYSWMYYTVLNLVIIQLIISLFENLASLGYAEINPVFKVIKKKMEKWFELDNNEE